MAIDFHAHYIAPKLMEMLEARDSDPRITHSGGGSLYHMPVSTLPYSTAYHCLSERIEYMDLIGMEKQVWSLPGLLGIDYLPIEQSLPMIRLSNDGIAEACHHHPDRLVALAAIPLADEKAMLAELKRCVEDYGFFGAILPNNAFLSLDHAKELAPLFEYANEKKLHFFIHPGWRADEYPILDTRPKGDPDELLIARGALGVQHSVSLALITLLYTDFLDAYPNMTTHIANLGGTFPMVVERMHHTVEARFPDAKMPPSRKENLYFDTSSLGPRAVELAVEIYGIDRLVLGTDTPIFSGETGLNVIKNTRLSEIEKTLILSGNARNLLSR